MTPRSTAGSATRFALVVTACVLALILAAGWVVQQKIDRTKATAFEIADRVANALQVRPKVVVHHRTIVEQQSDVLKLVTLEKTLTERQRLDESWLHSTKTFEIEADFVIRAGFDLSKPFVIEVDSSRAVRATLPPAEILATEMHDVRILRDEDGLWNRLTAADREQAIRELRLRISLRARESDLREQARTNAEKRLTELLARDGRTVTFTPSLSASSGVRE